MAEIHGRMPVVLGRETWERWLDPRTTTSDVAELLVPCADNALLVRPASRLVNDPRHDGPEVLKPEDEDVVQGELPI
jgi:putative SOS response-associated peptidase YedK